MWIFIKFKLNYLQSIWVTLTNTSDILHYLLRFKAHYKCLCFISALIILYTHIDIHINLLKYIRIEENQNFVICQCYPYQMGNFNKLQNSDFLNLKKYVRNTDFVFFLCNVTISTVLCPLIIKQPV